MNPKGFILLPVALLLGIVAAISYTLVHQATVGIGAGSNDLTREKAAMLAEAGLARAQWSANRSNCTNYTATGSKSLGGGSYEARFSPNNGSPVKITATGTLADGSSQQRETTAEVYSTASTSLPLQSANLVEATSIDPANPSVGSPGTLTVAGNGKHGLFRIETSLIDSIVPNGAYIESAFIEFNVVPTSTSGNVSEVFLYPVTTRWDSGSANWTNAQSARLWQTKGGDVALEAVAKANAAAAVPRWDITTLVRGWKTRRLPNFGALFALPSGAGMATFTVSNLVIPTQNPRLTISYRCNCGDIYCRSGFDGITMKKWEDIPSSDYVLNGGLWSNFYDSQITLSTQMSAVLKFDLPGNLGSGKIVDVRLNVYAQSGENISALTASAYLCQSWNRCDIRYSIGNANLSTATGLISFYIDPAVVEGWISGAINNNGIALLFNGLAGPVVPKLNIASKENGKSSQRPKLVITYQK